MSGNIVTVSGVVNSCGEYEVATPNGADHGAVGPTWSQAVPSRGLPLRKKCSIFTLGSLLAN